MHPSNCYSRSIRSVRHRPTGNTAQRPQPKRAHKTTYRSSTQHPSPPARVNSRLHSRNSFVSTSQPLLCKPAEARVVMWQEQWEATQSNLKTYDVHPKEQLPSGHTLPWRTANRVRSGQAATPTVKHLWGYRESETYVCGVATCDLGHVMTNCRHFGERPKRDEIAGIIRVNDYGLDVVTTFFWTN